METKMTSQNTEDEAVGLVCGFIIWQKRIVSQTNVKNAKKEFIVVRIVQVGSICIRMQYMCSCYGSGKPATATYLYYL
jgi:hypothetical protein